MTPEPVPTNPAVEPATDSARPSPEALRQRAEALARDRAGEMPENLDALSHDSARGALHELRVHQIELELQNEELRRTQQELEVSRERYFDLYNLAPVGYFTLNDEGLILEANLTAAQLLGVARGALVKQPLSHFILPESQDTLYLHSKALLEAGVPQALELRMLKTDAPPFWVRMEATVHQAAGETVWRAVVSDITAQKLEQGEKAKLEFQNRELQKAEGLGRMAGAIAHHFNNYLTTVMGNLDLALDGMPPGTNRAEELTDALHAASEAAGLSRLMLTYLGQTPARHDGLDLSAVCRLSLPLLRAAMPGKLVLNTDLPAAGPAIIADANQVQQMLTNLVTNAWEACGDSGSIRLAVQTVAAEDIPASHRPVEWSPRASAYACLEVADTGSGIAHEDLDRLFDPFFSSKFNGRGLGLPVVLGILRSHEGAVTVESQPGRGSTFRVFLPLSAEKALDPPSHAAEHPEIDGGGTVLLVDDEEMVRKVCRTALTSLGFKVLLAKDGVEAVEIFRQHQDKIRCVLCDLTMPRMDGWETLAALRKLAPGIPAILASGYDKAHVMAGDHAEMPQAFLSKPFQFRGLRDAIGRALADGRKT